MEENLTFANTQIPVTLDQQLREIAAKRRVSRSDVIRDALFSYVKKVASHSEDGPHAPTDESSYVLSMD